MEFSSNQFAVYSTRLTIWRNFLEITDRTNKKEILRAFLWLNVRKSKKMALLFWNK